MKGSTTIFNATKKANGVSKRAGKWSNLQEIKAKATNFNDPIQPVLRDLVKSGDIVKKPNIALWRVASDGGAGAGNGKSGYRSPDPYDSPRGRGKYPGRPTRRTSDAKTGRSHRKPSDNTHRARGRSRHGNSSDALAFGAAGAASSSTNAVMYRAMM